MADEWTPVEKTATGPDGAKMAFASGEWVPAERTATGPNGAKMAIIKQKSAPAAPKEPELPMHNPRTGLDAVMHAEGLGARYGVEAFVSPVTGGIDLLKSAAEKGAPLPGLFGLPGKISKKLGLPGADETFRKGLDELGFPKDESKIEKGLHTAADIAPAVIGMGALAKTGVGVLSKSEKIKKLTDLFTGAGVKEAAKKAEAAVAREAEKAAEATKIEGMKAELEARKSERVANDAAQERQRIQGLLDKPKPETQSLGATGQILESSGKAMIDQGMKLRSEIGNKAFEKVKTDAEALEKSGKFVDTSSATAPLQELMEHVKDVPGLRTKVSEMITMLKGDAAKEAPKLVDQFGKAFPTAAAKSQVPFRTLEVVRRYLDDVRYGADLEGYGAIGRKAAGDASKALNKAMADHLPSFSEYKDTWRKLSEPLDVMGTKLGRVLFDAEGGAAGKAVPKTPDAKIPEKLFSSKENIELYTKTLAGGEAASPAAKAQASKTVQNLALKFFEEQTSTMSPKATKALMDAPKTRDALSVLPKAQQVVSGRAAGELNKAAKIESLQAQENAAREAATAARNKSAKLLETRKDLSEQMFRADTMAKQSSDKARAKAVTMYTNILDKARDSGGISNETYKSMINTLDQIPDAVEKVAFMHKIANRAAWLLGGGGMVIGVETGRRMLK